MLSIFYLKKSFLMISDKSLPSCVDSVVDVVTTLVVVAADEVVCCCGVVFAWTGTVEEDIKRLSRTDITVNCECENLKLE